MNENTVLIIIMAGLGLIEFGLILSIHKLTRVLEGMNEKIKKFDGKVTNIEQAVILGAQKFKEFGSGKVSVKGNSPFGALDLELELHNKNEK